MPYLHISWHMMALLPWNIKEIFFKDIPFSHRQYVFLLFSFLFLIPWWVVSGLTWCNGRNLFLWKTWSLIFGALLHTRHHILSDSKVLHALNGDFICNYCVYISALYKPCIFGEKHNFIHFIFVTTKTVIPCFTTVLHVILLHSITGMGYLLFTGLSVTLLPWHIYTLQKCYTWTLFAQHVTFLSFTDTRHNSCSST
jgi:hypothetical protein